MGIKNIYSTFDKSKFLVLTVLLLTSCSLFQKQPSRQKGPVAPVITEDGEQARESNLPESDGEKPQVVVNLPKVGVILGPGGMKSYAHIGVLKELEKKNIKIDFISGIEWGAVVAALYSLKGSANEAEWQFMKLKADQVPQKGLFSKQVSPKDPSTVATYLRDTFGQLKAEDSQVPFGCPSYSLKTKRMDWFERGYFSNILMFCLPFPPHFRPHRNSVAAPFDLEGTAEYLRSKGAEIIIFVNPLQKGVNLEPSLVENMPASEILWQQIARYYGRENRVVDWVIGVNGRKYTLFDFEKRRNFVLFGQESGKRAAEIISEKYGF